MIQKGKKYRQLTDEEWRPIPGSENNYWISNYGRIKSYKINKKDGCFLKCSLLKNFRFIQLKYNDRLNTILVHKLVAQVWIPCPSEKHTIVTHLDRNLTNNHISNLKWLTQEESRKLNGEYCKKIFTGKILPDERHHAKLTPRDVVQLKTMLLRGTPQSKIAKMFCISEMQVTRIKRGENWGDIKIPEEKLKLLQKNK
ncbi:MAG: NUMOD4 domain-containing protein [Tenuifilaceae bacterium]